MGSYYALTGSFAEFNSGRSSIIDLVLLAMKFQRNFGWQSGSTR